MDTGNQSGPLEEQSWLATAGPYRHRFSYISQDYRESIK